MTSSVLLSKDPSKIPDPTPDHYIGSLLLHRPETTKKKDKISSFELSNQPVYL